MIIYNGHELKKMLEEHRMIQMIRAASNKMVSESLSRSIFGVLKPKPSDKFMIDTNKLPLDIDFKIRDNFGVQVIDTLKYSVINNFVS